MRQPTRQTLRRLLLILQWLPRAPGKVSTPELQKRLAAEGIEVTARTIQRDLHELGTLFPLGLDERDRPYGWSWDARTRTAMVPALSPAQAMSVLMAQSHLASLMPQAMLEDIDELALAAHDALRTSGYQHWVQRTAVVPPTLRLIPPDLDREVLARVQRAVALRRCISIDYRAKGRSSPRNYIISPLGVLSRGSVLYLVGTVDGYDDPRQFAIHRIHASTVLATPGSEPHDFSFRAYAKEVAGRFHASEPVELVFRVDAPAAEHLAEQRLSDDQMLQPVAGTDKVEIRATVVEDETLRWWLLAFGSQVEVLEPRHLRAWMQAELEYAAENYSRDKKGGAKNE